MTDSASQAEVRGDGPRPGGSGIAPFVVLGLLYVIAVVVYSLLARQSPIPLLLPDETIYGTLAQSLAGGDGPTIRGVFDTHSTLYPYLIAPAWDLASGGDAFEIAQTIGAALVCLTVIPVWLLARRYVGPWPAFVPALLIVSGSWMLTAAGLLTENAALPLSTAALAATVAAIARPGSRWAWVALGLVLPASIARLQLVVLVPVIAAAVAIDCARFRAEWRERLAAHRVLAAASGGLTLIGAIAVVASPDSVLGIYDRFETPPDADVFGNALKDQLTGLLAMAAVLPVVIVAAGAARLENWRDERLGPLLAVTSATVLIFLAQGAWALATFLEDGLVPWHIQRYVEYAMPLLLVTMTVLIVWRRVPARELAIAGAVATLVLLATPGVRNVQEERGLFGLQERVNSILSSSAGVSLAIVSALVVAVAVLATIRLRGRPAAALGVVSAAILVAYLVQAQVLWRWQDMTTSGLARALPENRSWIDDAADGSVAGLLAVSSTARSQLTHFFNPSVDRVYVLPGSGTPSGSARVCTWRPNSAGVVDWGAACGTGPKQLLLDDDFGKIQFHDQKVLETQPGNGRLVALDAPPPSRARLKSVLRVPCGPVRPQTELAGHGSLHHPRPPCFPVLGGAFWLDRPGTLKLSFRGGKQPYRIGFSAPARVDVIRPRTDTTLRLPLPQGASSFEAQLEWQQAGPDFPELTAAQIVERDGTATELLY